MTSPTAPSARAMIAPNRLSQLIADWDHEAAVARASLRRDDYPQRCQETVEALRELERLRTAVDSHNSQCLEVCKSRVRTDRCDRYRNRGINCPDCPCNDRIIMMDF